MIATKTSPQLLDRILQYIVEPPLVKQSNRKEWQKKEEKRRRKMEHQESMLALRSLLNVNREQPESSEHSQLLILQAEEKPRPYIKTKKTALRELFQCFLSEFIGTFILVLCYSTMRVESQLNRLTSVENALGQGFLSAALVYALGNSSGAHFNPVLTLVFILRRVFPAVWLPIFYIAQLTGAIAAGGVLRRLYKQDAIYGTNAVDPQLLSSNGLGFCWEILVSFFLMLVVLQTATRDKITGPLAAIAVGCITALNAIIGQVASSSVNPFRVLGPAIVNSSEDGRDSLWIYLIGPFVGGLIAVVMVTLLNFGSSPEDDEDSSEKSMAQA